jgi:hypothetical protein
MSAPFDDGLRFDDDQDIPPILPELREAPRRIDPADAVAAGEFSGLGGPVAFELATLIVSQIIERAGGERNFLSGGLGAAKNFSTGMKFGRNFPPLSTTIYWRLEDAIW